MFGAAAQSNYGSGTYRSPYSDLYIGSPLTEFHADILDKNRPANTKDTMMVDFASRQITFSRIDRVTGMPIWEFHYGEMEDFLRDMENHTIQSLWNEIAREHGKTARKDNQPKQSGLTFAMPAHLPRWATRILGQEPPKLSITGTQKIKFGVNRSVSGTRDNEEKAVVSPQFQPTSDFSIKGSVGRLLHLEINLRGETGKDDFFEQAKEQLSQIKIHYREQIPGELEDDIIQEVEIGKTSFQMPGQGLAGFSTGSNENLFGVKVRSKLGPLELTTIASIENVETQTKTINSNETRTDTISELNYIKNQFFYLDEIYKQFAEGAVSSATNINTERVMVLQRVSGIIPNEDIRFAIYGTGTDTLAGIFKRLKQGVDYDIDVGSMTHQGVIKFSRSLADNDVIGVVWHDEGINKSDTTKRQITIQDSTVMAYKNLWILKSDGQKITDPTYDLMLRNVYNVGTSDAVSFELKIFRQSSDKSLQEQNDLGEYFTDILGLSENRLISKENTKIFDLTNGYMYIPSSKSAISNKNWVFMDTSLGKTGDVNNYHGTNAYNDAEINNVTQMYKITTKSKKRSDRFNLDFGVVEGSERLWTVSGDSLVRNVDYSIDYGYGSVILLSPKALAADIIEASYQKEALFLLDKKVFIGINGKLNLEGVGRNSYLSTTVMWQLMDAKKMMPRVGTEPYNRFLFDSNLRLDFTPLWMTSLINRIPLIEREAQSEATFDFEVAHSSVKNSARSGGEAYIDNFSTSSKTYTLGTAHTVWHRAGPDDDIIKNIDYKPPAWHHYWYQPTEGDGRAYRNEIYPQDPNANGRDASDRMNTLKLVVEPYPKDADLRRGVDADGTPRVKPWAGISYGLSSALRDRSEDRFFEFWIRPVSKDKKYRAKGMLTVDFGIVGEDLSLDGGLPNGRENREAWATTVSEGNDYGIDATKDEFEYWLYPRFTDTKMVWDTIFYDDPRLGEWATDPARDNWDLYDRNNRDKRRYANGTEGNLSIKSTPDAEDIDGDGRVTFESSASYFRYKIDLERIEDSPFHNKVQVANTANSGWIQIRIPVGFVPDSIQNPRGDTIYQEIRTPMWNSIHHVRILWTELQESKNSEGVIIPDTLEFEGIQFVGNQWREQSYDSTETNSNSGNTTTGRVIASVLDSRTDPLYDYPKGKRLDSLSGDEAVDYTLRLEFNGIPKDSSVFVSRKFEQSQSLNLTNYRTIKFYAQTKKTTSNTSEITSNGDNWLIFRFGSDSTTYYEYKTRRVDEVGWVNPGFTINLDDLTQLKLDWFNTYSERYGSIDTAWAVQSSSGKGFDTLKVYTQTRVSPTLSNISWIAFGIENNSPGEAIFDLRLNGFRAAGISDYEGWAVRASMKLKWSDFIENSADFKYTDAHFRSMSDNVLKESNAQVSSGVASKIQLDKFLPDRLGVQIPLGGEMTASLQRPEMRPNSDISLRNEDGNPDRLGDMAGDFGRSITKSDEKGEVTESEKYEKRGRSRSAYTGYRKNKTSEKIVPRLIADRIGIDYRLNYRDSTARMGEVPDNEKNKISRSGFEKYHAEVITSQQHNAVLDYNFSPSKKVIETLSWEPFKNVKNPNLSRKIKTMSFNLMPERVMFDIATVNYAKREEYSSIQDAIDTTGYYAANKRPVEEVGIRHALNVTYKPINPFITMNYNLDIDRNFDRYIKGWGKSGVSEFASSAVFKLDPIYGPYNVLFSEQRRNQDMKISFTPEITRWLTINSNFGGGYTQNMELVTDTSYMRTTINSSFDISPTFNIRRLFEDISRGAKKSEKFSNGMGNVAKGMEVIGFESINVSYRTSMGLGNSYLDMDYLDYGLDRSNARYLLYSFGLYDRSFKDYFTGNMSDASAFGGVQNRNNWWEYGGQKNASDTRNTSQNVNASTSLKIPKPVEISINNISLGWTRTYSITPEADRLDTSITFPDFRIGASSSAMEQIGVVKDNFSTFRLDWGFTRRHTFTRSGIPSEKIENNHTISWGFTPLIKVATRLKKIGLDLSYSIDLGFDTTRTYDSVLVDKATNLWEKDTLNRASQKVTVSQNWTAGYHIDGRRGRTIRLFRDQIVEINGDIDFSVTFGYTKTKNRFHPETSITGESQNYDDITITAKPQVAYKFTRNIDAILFYELRRTITGKEEHLSHNGTVAMEVTISF